MSEGPSAAGTARRAGSGASRVVRAWRALPHESRLAAFASAALVVTLFLPWYQVTLIARAKSAALESASASITGWGAFSFVEAAVLLVAGGVLTLLFQRAEGRAFHLPGGDGAVITAAGLWTCVLIVWRIFDKQGATANGPSATTSGVEWGIFFALGAAAFLAYSGSRIRAAHRPEPPLPGEDRPPADSSAAATAVLPRRRARPPMPVPADPATRRDRPVRAGDPTTEHHRPRRRANAAELFEPVIPDDPPTMPFGRAKRADVDITVRRREPKPADEQLTMPFREDETIPFREDDTIRFRDDETLRLGKDATVPLGKDATVPRGEDATVPRGKDATVPLGDDDTLPLDR